MKKNDRSLLDMHAEMQEEYDPVVEPVTEPRQELLETARAIVVAMLSQPKY